MVTEGLTPVAEVMTGINKIKNCQHWRREHLDGAYCTKSMLVQNWTELDIVKGGTESLDFIPSVVAV